MESEVATLDDLVAQAAWMRGLAQRLLGDRDEADDVVQDAWLSAMRFPPLRGQTLRPWFATVVRNLVRSRMRHDARRQAREELYGSSAASPDAEAQLAQRQIERRLAELVLALDEPYRQTILLHFHEGRSSADIARAEGLPEGTVRWRLKRALDELRGRLGAGDHEGKAALGVLVPIAGHRPALLPSPATLARLTLAKTKAIVALAGAVAALAVATAGVRAHRYRAQPLASAPRLHAVAPATTMAMASPRPMAASPASAALVRDPARAPVTGASDAITPARVLTGITGIVRDSRGVLAAHVPVTLRSLAGTGAADRTTMTDDDGQFSYALRTRSRFALTAELPGEPAARLELEVLAKSAQGLDAISSSPMTSASFATIDVTLAAGARRLPARRSRPETESQRWCCHHAIVIGDVVDGRACLKIDDGGLGDQGGCEVYGLKTQVACHHYTRGGFSTGDLSRTDRLDCDGNLM